MSSSVTRYFQVSDGRTLSYSDRGTGNKGTWIHCHGIPGSRHELDHIAEDPSFAGLRVIIPDRPGYGDSTLHPHYGFAEHTADLKQLADHLGLERFSVSGFSGGGVFALATAHDLGKRINRLTIAATPAVPLMTNPFDYASELTANTWKAALENADALAFELEALTASNETLSEALERATGPDETKAFSSGHFRTCFLQSTGTALQQGATVSARALARDSRLTAGKWPFRIKEITLPVSIIHGRIDKLVGREHQSALMQHLPQARKILLREEGHYGVLRGIFSS